MKSILALYVSVIFSQLIPSPNGPKENVATLHGSDEMWTPTQIFLLQELGVNTEGFSVLDGFPEEQRRARGLQNVWQKWTQELDGKLGTS